MIIREDRDSRARWKSIFDEPTSDRFRHSLHFAIAITFQPVAPLNLQSDMLGPELGAFAKTVIKRGHA